MSGPIVRTGTTPKFWENWEQAFGGAKSSGKSSGSTQQKQTVATEDAKSKDATKKSLKKTKK